MSETFGDSIHDSWLHVTPGLLRVFPGQKFVHVGNAWGIFHIFGRHTLAIHLGKSYQILPALSLQISILDMVGKHTLTHHAKYDQNHLLGLVKLCLILWFKFIIFEGSEEFDLQSTHGDHDRLDIFWPTMHTNALSSFQFKIQKTCLGQS